MLFGVDSATGTTTAMADGTLFIDYITRVATPPGGPSLSFWGRYIGGLYSITSGEAAFLQTRNFKILVIYNGAGPGSVQGGLSAGQNDAAKAVKAAHALDIPAGRAIFADVENTWLPTPDWIKAWATSIAAAGYVPGYYCNPNPKDSTFCNQFCAAATQEPAVARSLIYSCNPCHLGAPSPPRPAAIQATIPSCGAAGVIWQYAVTCYPPSLNPETDRYFVVDLDCAQDSLSAILW